MTNRQTIFEEINSERDYQINKWGTESDEKLNTPNDWVGYITNYAGRWMDGTFRPYRKQTLDQFRSSMVKVATLAVAAIEETDKIIQGKNDRPDILDPEDGFETSGISATTKNIPLAIVGDRLREMGFKVAFMTGPVVMYRNEVIESRSENFAITSFSDLDVDYIFLYSIVDGAGNQLADNLISTATAKRIRFGTL